ARHEAQMIVAVTPGIAAWPPAADLAVVRGLGIRRRAAIAVDAALECALDATVVVDQLVQSKCLRSETGARRHDVHVLREHPLQPADQLGVETELKDRACARLARE